MYWFFFNKAVLNYFIYDMIVAPIKLLCHISNVDKIIIRAVIGVTSLTLMQNMGSSWKFTFFKLRKQAIRFLQKVHIEDWGSFLLKWLCELTKFSHLVEVRYHSPVHCTYLSYSFHDETQIYRQLGKESHGGTLSFQRKVKGTWCFLNKVLTRNKPQTKSKKTTSFWIKE